MKKILITGGAGFVGSNLAILYKKNHSDARVVALDNLKRRGSEIILSRLREEGVEFLHGDVRNKEDLFEAGEQDLLIDCAAEPSVMAGRDGSPHYVIDTNLKGTINALELARETGAKVIFLSTSRVYPIAALNSIKLKESTERFDIAEAQSMPGISQQGITEDFPLNGARTIYGSSKLCSELLLQEYLDCYGVKGVINRCGVLTGPWQMGKVDQGFVVLWMARHFYGGKLSYIGYNGSGKQVRDIMHVQDLYSLIELQLNNLDKINGEIFNVGGGRNISVSLAELTRYCREYTKNKIDIAADQNTRPGDVPLYITDYSKVKSLLNWEPKIGLAAILEEVYSWIRDNRVALEPILR